MDFVSAIVKQFIDNYQPYCAKCGGGLRENSFNLTKKTRGIQLLVLESHCPVCSCPGKIRWDYPDKQPLAGETVVLLGSILSFEVILREAEEILGLTH